MKLRIHGNSVRLRLKQAEVAVIAGGGTVEGVCAIPGQRFTYRLTPGEDFTACHSLGTLSVFVPQEALTRWANSDQVGISGAAGAIDVLIEKDWNCIEASNPADNEDTFPHPAPSC